MDKPAPSSPPTQWYSTFTVGYSDSEDRVWIRLSSAEGDVRMWITRRFMALILQKSYGLLSGGLPPDQAAAQHEQCVADLRANGSGVPSREFDPGLQNKNLGLVATVHLNCQAGVMSWVFESAADSVGFRCDIVSAHQVLEALFMRQQQSGWAIAAPWISTTKNDSGNAATGAPAPASAGAAGQA